MKYICTIKAVIITLATLLLVDNSKVLACSCIGEIKVHDAINAADAVVVGTVLSKQSISLTDSTIIKEFPKDTVMRKSLWESNFVCYKVAVQEIYKGKITHDTISIYSGRGGGDCGIEFNIGGRYIVYCTNRTYLSGIYNHIQYPEGSNIFWTHMCTGTTYYNSNKITEIEKYTQKQPHR